MFHQRVPGVIAAAILKVSTDELLLGRELHDAELEISDVRLLDKFQRLQELDKRDCEAGIILIDGVLASRAVESAIADHFLCLPGEIHPIVGRTKVIARGFRSMRELLRNCGRLPDMLTDSADAIALTGLEAERRHHLSESDVILRRNLPHVKHGELRERFA